MLENLRKYLPFVEGITELFYPFVEGAIHDLESGTLVALFNNISKRKIGDLTPLKNLNINTEDFPEYFPPYYKDNWDGKKLKCISITIKNAKGKPIGLICYNVDISFFQEFDQKLSKFLQLKSLNENPIEMYGENWQNQTRSKVDAYLEKHSLLQSGLNRMQKKELIRYLYKEGIFNFKNSAPYVAELLGISRASLYNYLK